MQVRVIIDTSKENLISPAFLCPSSAPTLTVSWQGCHSVENDDEIALLWPMETDTCPKAWCCELAAMPSAFLPYNLMHLFSQQLLCQLSLSPVLGKLFFIALYLLTSTGKRSWHKICRCVKPKS